MNTIIANLLITAAVGQAIVACLNLSLVRLMHWERDIAAMSQLVREVFQVHKWFISITLWIFAGLTIAFADLLSLGEDPLARSLAGCIALFWGIRTVIQVGYYSSSHWRGIPSRTAVHIILLTAYAGLTLLYGFVALGGRI